MAGGFGLDMWATVVDRSGIVRATFRASPGPTASGPTPSDAIGLEQSINTAPPAAHASGGDSAVPPASTASSRPMSSACAGLIRALAVAGSNHAQRSTSG